MSRNNAIKHANVVAHDQPVYPRISIRRYSVHCNDDTDSESSGQTISIHGVIRYASKINLPIMYTSSAPTLIYFEPIHTFLHTRDTSREKRYYVDSVAQDQYVDTRSLI